MSNLQSRVKAVEQIHGRGKVNKYMCVISGLAWDGPAEVAKAYKIQPFTRDAGGTGGEPFYIQTFKELKEFEARPDVNLTIIEVLINAAGPAHNPRENYPADYISQGVTPPDLLH